MSAQLKPHYAIYVLRMDAQHIDITRGYSAAGAPTTTLQFGAFHRQSTYRVWYRSFDQKSLMQEVGSSATSVVPPIPWALDLVAPPSAQSSANESVRAGGAAIDQATQHLSEIYTDEKSAYHISFVNKEEFAGHQAYQLTLQNATGDPNDHALRRLFVDETSFLPLEEVVKVGQNTLMFGGGLTMTVTFGQVGPYWLSTSGSVIGDGHFAFIPVHGTFTYSASDFEFPAQIPETIFTGDPRP